jgi:hypothetical protein
MNEIADDFTYYFSKLLSFANQTQCYEQMKADSELILLASNTLLEYKAGNVSLTAFTDVCADNKC